MMNQSKAQEVRTYLLQALLMINTARSPTETEDIKTSLHRVMQAQKLLQEMVKESIISNE